jgi:hypothetical protein
MTALLMNGPEPLGPALCHHSGRYPPGTSSPVQAHYGIYRPPGWERPEQVIRLAGGLGLHVLQDLAHPGGVEADQGVEKHPSDGALLRLVFVHAPLLYRL